MSEHAETLLVGQIGNYALTGLKSSFAAAVEELTGDGGLATPEGCQGWLRHGAKHGAPFATVGLANIRTYMRLVSIGKQCKEHAPTLQRSAAALMRWNSHRMNGNISKHTTGYCIAACSRAKSG